MNVFSSRSVTMQNKEVQTEFPAAMLEEYVLDNRRRILKLLRFPQNSLSQTGRKTFKDLLECRMNEDMKTSRGMDQPGIVKETLKNQHSLSNNEVSSVTKNFVSIQALRMINKLTYCICCNIQRGNNSLQKLHAN